MISNMNSLIFLQKTVDLVSLNNIIQNKQQISK